MKRPDWAGFEDAFPRVWSETEGITFQIETFWWREVFQHSIDWRPPQGLWHGRELDWLSWKRGPAWFAFRSGFNGGNHNNLDLGQIIVGHGEHRVMGDPGYGDCSTSRHSCFTVRRADQTPDACARTLQVREWEVDGRWYLYICCDLRAAYPHSLDRHYRHVIACEDGTVFLMEELLARARRRLGVQGHLQMKGPVDQKEPGLCRMEGGEVSWYVRSHSPLNLKCLKPFTHNAVTLHSIYYAPFLTIRKRAC